MHVSTLDFTKGDICSINRLFDLHQFYTKNGDLQAADKIRDLLAKVMDGEKIIAFCGHFSAGKSSMINWLIGADILAASPIPTSANLVKLKASDNISFKIFYKDGAVREYKPTDSFGHFKQYFKNGESIKRVEIAYPSKFLPKGAVIMDTPGIDSTDDAHRLATEGALHLADALFYVMDYNHVMAEENFLFTKEMANHGKEVYLVINMIDKHQANELSFDTYQKSIADAFLAWDIQPVKIFYTSLKEIDHPHNELTSMVEELRHIFAKKEPVPLEGSLRLVMEEHLRKVSEDQEMRRNELEQILSSITVEEQNHLEADLKQLQEEIEIKESGLQNFRDQMIADIQEMLKNAYLMPAETRELAKEYLESVQKDFKVGLFFSKKKTEEVRKARFDFFYQALQKTVDTQLSVHLKKLFLSTLKQYNIQPFEIESQVQKLTIPVKNEHIENAVKPGALVTGESVLHFTNEVADNLKKYVISISHNLLAKIETVLLETLETELDGIKRKHQERQHLLSAKNELDQMDKEYKFVKDQLLTIMNRENTQLDRHTIEEIQTIVYTESQVNGIVEEPLEVNKENKEPQNDQTKTVKKASTGQSFAFHLEQQKIIQKLERTAELLTDIPNMDKIRKQLIERANRLNQKQFTVALFGAFSAGKSSFANALVGEKILPVSPNPTTAAINRILPANDEHPTKTGVVTLKREEQMLADVNEALEKFDIDAKNLEEAVSIVGKIIQRIDRTQSFQTQISFLTAFAKGYPVFKHQLGEKVTVGLEEFQQFVALEERSCFVEAIDFYYESEATNEGIAFVDTPGADSINARHTDVAFDYIKKADAIVFVTYYNHAFSKADREFLIQLGRVKDQFALDKMFFIVNAIDLANTEEELQDVLSYVEQQLLTYGIRNAKIYPVSSQNALKEKKTGEKHGSRFPLFEQDFYRFITNDLGQITLQAGQSEWEHAVDRLKHLIETASTDEQMKEEKRETLRSEKETAEQSIRTYTSSILKEQVNEELKELIYYIYQRTNYRFNDFFKEAFNPATIKGSGHEAKQALHQAMKELLHSVGFDLAQELRATSLRLENFLSLKLKEIYEKLLQQLLKINGNLSFSLYEPDRVETVVFQNELKDLPLDLFTKALAGFKNTRTFFEKNEKKQMAEMIQAILQEQMKANLAKNEAALSTHFTAILEQQFAEMIEQIRSEIAEQYEGWLSILDDKIDIGHLKNRLNEVELLSVNQS